jgi:sulfate transport system ATP-binding protein
VNIETSSTQMSTFAPMRIGVEALSQRFGAFAALNDVSLDVEPGELLALLGPSGSGKTTLLRAIAGLATPDAGRILFQGEDATDLSLRDRRVGFVFQHYALFRHMTVFDNIAFGLRVRPRASRPSSREIAARVERLLALVQLDGLGGRFPHQLSGGQRQRVALARALAIEPQVLLLDEPFGALDAKVRKELRQWLRGLHLETGLTTIFVTHDQEEAMELADRVVIMREGRIEQLGTPAAIYQRPATPFVCEFLGNVLKFQTVVTEGKADVLGASFDASSHGAAVAYVRSHEIDVSAEAGVGVAARLLGLRVAGPMMALEFQLPGFAAPVEVLLGHEQAATLVLEIGRDYGLRARAAHIFDVA